MALHVNGVKNVSFRPVPVLSRAQLRDNIADAQEVGTTWTRFDANSGAIRRLFRGIGKRQELV